MSISDELSLWGQAIVAVVAGDAMSLRALLNRQSETDINLTTQRVSYDDVDFLFECFGVHILPGRTLVDLALERDHEDCVALFLPQAPKRGNSFDARAPQVRRAISEVGPAVLAEALRDHLAEHIEVVKQGSLAGLPRLLLPPAERKVFVLPRELSALDGTQWRHVAGLLIEATDVLPQVERAVGWWNSALASAVGIPSHDTSSRERWGLVPLYTSADGNCLLHGCLLSSLGIRDRRVAVAGYDLGASSADDPRPRRLLRATLHAALTGCPLLRELLKSYGAQLGGDDGLESRTVCHGHSLDGCHILCLAHILGRPIVCYASGEMEFRDTSGMSATEAVANGLRLSGIYLPLLMNPSECTRDPILLAYTQGHFSALVTFEAAADGDAWRALGLQPLASGVDPSVPVPLVDEELGALPVVFIPKGDPQPDALLGQYMDVAQARLPPTGVQVPVAMQRCPARQQSHSGMSALPADAYFAADWKQRIRQLASQSATGIDAQPSEEAPYVHY